MLDEAGLVAFDPSFNKGGDIIRLSGNAAEWQVIRSGSSALFVDGDTFVQLSIGTAGTPIVFDDGMRSLRYDSGAATMKIGSQAFGTAFVTVTADPDGTLLPTGADAAADARLFLAAGTSASAGGKIGIFGTASTELLSLLSGTISLDPSFNKGGDIISFNLPATDFLASRVGSSVLLDSATTDALIPIGTTGTTLTFTDGDDRYVLYDSTIPGVLIGDQIITGTPSALMAFG